MMRTSACVSAALALTGSALSQTYNYDYDALGRLTRVTPSSGNKTCYWYNAADNRLAVESSTTCTGSTNPNGPIGSADWIYEISPVPVASMAIDVLSNDYDADLPYDRLEVTSVAGDSHFTVANNAAGGYGLSFNGPAGVYTVTYMLRDSAGMTYGPVEAYVEIVYCPFWEC